MTYLKKIFLVIPFFLLSCSSNLYVENYDPINKFLDTQNLNKNKVYILQSDKELNKQALRIFNGGEGSEHTINLTDPTDYTYGLFVEKYWKKMYTDYAGDTLKKYWKKEDFPNYNFILEKGTGLTLKESFLKKYKNSKINEMIILSEPMYYHNKKYIMFYYLKIYFESSGTSQVVIMKKNKNKWEVAKIVGDYIYN
ncbi:hypothetical protein HNP37_000040 [Flavobacterium nitrogenifigens]|uniref:Lipoprotein n=2 Tax=Flavobacterium TaxID=237 RepID=A0A7W7IT14_9FLAO|nr:MULTISPECIES: hypothetical protein [Flavobacterium]MBB4800001.1 hypothetical protein [Flavobacterium nitrogenifigens]MBB6386249.1 hypothetical protein [Flavobacterium notoginsengisoli]